MAEHAERRDVSEDATQALPPASAHPTPADATESSQKKRKEPQFDWREIKDQVVSVLATVIRWAGLVFALILVLHVIFVIGGANVDNGIVSWVSDAADTLAIGFKDLFTPEDPKLLVLVNFGIAALFWLVVSTILAGLIRRIGGSS